MKNFLDERQNQTLGKQATISFTVMYAVCAITIVVQLVFGNGSIKAVMGETVVMAAGGVSYLIGVVKAGCFSRKGKENSKKSGLFNLILSSLLAAVFSMFYGIIISSKSVSGNLKIGKYVAFFFIVMTVLCFLVLTILGAMSDKSVKNAEKKYADADNAEADRNEGTMQPQRVFMAESSMEAGMLIEMLDKNGIPAYKQSLDGGIMEAYSGNSNKGDYLYVGYSDMEKAKELIEQYKMS